MSEQIVLFQKAQFLTSAPDIRHMPEDSGVEIAFAGRSNAGKSSALNALTRQKRLAKTSSTPGRTQLINVFTLSDSQRLIDLPGYGYAKVPLEVKEKWQKALGEYLQMRESLKGLVVLMDIRHPLKDLDQQLIDWAAQSEIPVLALLTKADKLKQGPRKQMLLKVREACLVFGDGVQVELFSSLKKLGLPQVEKTLSAWLLQDEESPEKE